MTTVKNNGSLVVTCCKCALKHLWTYKIIRGKTPVDDVVELGVHVLNAEPEKIKPGEP